ncbi:MAG: hypothetical protein FJ224_03365 [Lentisphaerae bacterium]|nr:hypothetical protein [Lentisphaerota bacterium]
MAQDWDIRPRSDTCTHCAQPFLDGQAYMSGLSADETGYRRGDYHEACWNDLGESRPRCFSLWRSVFRAPPPEPDEPLKRENAESLLRKLIEQEDAAHRNVIYILAVMLERKRVFVERAVERKEDGATMRLYEHRKTKETFLISEPHLRLDELETVQAEVIAMLDGQQGKDP